MYKSGIHEHRLRSLVHTAVMALALCSASPVSAAWHDTPTTRLEALALIQTLNAELLSANSATLTLERWCMDHALAAPAVIVAHQIQGAELPADDELRQRLQVDAAEPLRHRRVELRCGAHVLSVADNWYVSSRLTAGMNQLLDTTDTPFGKVVLPLRPRRETVSAEMRWSPMPKGWEMTAPKRRSERAMSRWLNVPETLFEHHAVVYTGDHLPIAEVHERYQRGLLDFPEPHPR